MIVLRIVLIVIGIPFIYYGFNILFMEKYNLINNYEKDKKIGKVDEGFAKRVGAIEFFGGKICLILGIAAMFLEDKYTLYFFAAGIGGIILLLSVNQFFFRKKKSKDKNY
jgi:hypothetical protein